MHVLRPMTESEYAAWLADTIPAYAADKVASGQWSDDESLELSRREYDELLPQHMGTPGNHFFIIQGEGDQAVGVLWFAEQVRAGARVAYVYDIAVKPERQREGHAWRALQALENEARRLGLAGISLHVFGHNSGARALYAKLGFQPTNIVLFKRVEPAGA